MTDDGVGHRAGRRDVLKYIGGAGTAATAGLGAFALTGSQPAGAAVLADSPVETLPGTASRETAHFHEEEVHDGDRTLLNADVIRGIQMTNFRVVREEDAVHGPCGGTDALEYQFLAYGMANSMERVETAVGEFEPVGSEDLSHPIASSHSDRPRVSAHLEDAPCGPTTLRPHNVQIVTSDDPADAFARYREAISNETTDEIVERLRATNELSDLQTASILEGFADGAAWKAGFGADTVEEYWPDGRSAGSDLKTASRVVDIGFVLGEIVENGFDAADSSSGDEYGLYEFQGTDDGGACVVWTAEFTVRVPAGESLTVDVESWASPLDQSDTTVDHDFLTSAVTPGVGFEIDIPANLPDDDLEALDLPSIGAEPLDEFWRGNPAMTVAPESPASGTGTFGLDRDDYDIAGEAGTTLDVVDSEWLIDNGSSDAETLEYTFQRNGPHTAEARLEADPALWDYDVSLGSRHMLDVDVGEELHTQPTVEFSVDPPKPTVGEPITAEVESVNSRFGDVESIDWSVSSRKIGDLSDGETTDVCVPGSTSASGDSITITPQCRGVYRFACTVTDDAGNPSRTVVQDVVAESETIARFDVEPEYPAPGDTIELDASPTTPGAGDVYEYDWTVSVTPKGGGSTTDPEFHTDTGAQTSFEAPSIADYIVTLDVVDEVGDEDSAQTTVKVREAATCGGDPVADTASVDGQTVCDVDGDGNYRDVNGDGSVSNSDITEFFSTQHTPAWNERTDLFDFDGNDDVGQSDVITLFHYVN